MGENNVTSAPVFSKHSIFEKQLRLAAAAWFKEKGHPVHHKMGYCLEKWINWDKNIIVDKVANYIKSEREKAGDRFPLHKYVHHGLSSQAMVFNLLGPLIIKDDLAPLIHLLKSKGVEGDFTNALFEYDDKDVFQELSGQPTSMDVVLLDSKGKPRVFIESKFTEKEFGGCSVFRKGDCTGKNPLGDLKTCYLHRLGRTYWNMIKDYGFDQELIKDRICVFVNYYQFFRELLFSLKHDSTFVLLYDERGHVFHSGNNGITPGGLIPFLKEFVPQQYHNRIVLITVQEVLTAIRETGRHEDWVGEFERKYVIKVKYNNLLK